MPAYVRVIHPPKCQVCGAKATVEVFNGQNASCGFYCGKHGHRKVEEMNR